MQGTPERVTDRRGGKPVPVKYFYRRQYQTAGGNWSTIYYAIFTDWRGMRRQIPLGDKLPSARDKLDELHRKNNAEFDFDRKRRQSAKRGI